MEVKQIIINGDVHLHTTSLEDFSNEYDGYSFEDLREDGEIEPEEFEGFTLGEAIDFLVESVKETENGYEFDKTRYVTKVTDPETRIFLDTSMETGNLILKSQLGNCKAIMFIPIGDDLTYRYSIHYQD